MFIALTGAHGAGKSTVASILKYMGFEIRSLADPLKKTLSLITGKDMFDDGNKEVIYAPMNITYAQLMVAYGEGMKKILYPSIWIDKFYESSVSKWPVVCDDLYSLEEYEACKKHGGFVILITRPGVNRRDGRDDVVDIPHDYVINNDEGMQELVNKVRYRVGDIELRLHHCINP